MARSGHFNHQRHAQQQAEFFARVEAERRAMQREVDHLQLHTMDYPEYDDEQPEQDDAADYSWTHDRS